MATNVMNQATINYSYSGSGESFSLTSNESTISLQSENSISVTKTAQTDTFTPGGLVNFSVAITNNGSTYFTGVRVTDDLGTNGNMYYVTGSALLFYNGQYIRPQIASTNPLVFTLSPLASGQSMVLSYTAQVPNSSTADEITNTVEAIGYTWNTSVSDSSSATITRTNAPVISIEKSSSSSSVSYGQLFNYTITLTNSGNIAADVESIVDNLPTGFVISSVSLKIGNGSTITLSPNDYTLDSNNLFTLPSSTGPSITVPAESTTIVTISGYFSN